jgi:hypothetical protein
MRIKTELKPKKIKKFVEKHNNDIKIVEVCIIKQLDEKKEKTFLEVHIIEEENKSDIIEIPLHLVKNEIEIAIYILGYIQLLL